MRYRCIRPTTINSPVGQRYVETGEFIEQDEALGPPNEHFVEAPAPLNEAGEDEGQIEERERLERLKSARRARFDLLMATAGISAPEAIATVWGGSEEEVPEDVQALVQVAPIEAPAEEVPPAPVVVTEEESEEEKPETPADEI